VLPLEQFHPEGLFQFDGQLRGDRLRHTHQLRGAQYRKLVVRLQEQYDLPRIQA
jgi:hypothetical protein